MLAFSHFRCKEHCIVPTRMRQLSFAIQNLYATVHANLQGAPLVGVGTTAAADGQDAGMRVVLDFSVVVNEVHLV